MLVLRCYCHLNERFGSLFWIRLTEKKWQYLLAIRKFKSAEGFSKRWIFYLVFICCFPFCCVKVTTLCLGLDIIVSWVLHVATTFHDNNIFKRLNEISVELKFVFINFFHYFFFRFPSSGRFLCVPRIGPQYFSVSIRSSDRHSSPCVPTQLFSIFHFLIFFCIHFRLCVRVTKERD